MYQVGNIMIAAESVEKMVASFTVAVPIAADSDNHKFGIDHLGGRRGWQCPAMKYV
jgi:hypothetical protein